MNIFYLSNYPTNAASYLVDKHVRKMLIETCQILSTVQRSLLGYRDTIPINGKLRFRQAIRNPDLDRLLMESTHENHPCVQWTKEAYENYGWLANYLRELYSEHMTRFGSESLQETTHELVSKLHINIPLACFPFLTFTQPPCVMPEEFSSFHHLSVVSRYRLYYKSKLTNNPKTLPSVWTKKEKPHWL